MKQVYLLCYFLFGSLLTIAQNCPPTNLALQLNISQPAYCSNDEVNLSTNVSAVNYFWHLGQGNVLVTTTPRLITSYRRGGVYEIMLVADYGNNCRDSATALVEIVDAAVEFDYTITDNVVAFEADTSTYILNYFWNFGNQLTGSGASVITRYPSVGSYPVTLFTSGICPPDSTTQIITILPPTPTEDTPTTCGDGIDNDGDGLIDCADSDCACDEDNDGILATEDPDDNNPCVPDNTIAGCEPTNIPPLFEEFPFLETFVNPNNCTGEKISLYQQGSFFFLFVETSTSRKLYFQTGQFYCESTPTYDCVGAYNLGDAINSWTCNSVNVVDNDNDGVLSDIDPDDDNPCIPDDTVTNCIKDVDEDGIFSDVDPDDNDPCVPNSTMANCVVDTAGVAIPVFFSDFPWLSDIVNPANCDGTKISIYQSGAFSFIYVETAESSTLYFENGTFYCQSAPNFDCLAAYNLSNPYKEWTCSGATIIDADNDGTPAQTDPDDDNPCIPDDTVTNCIKDVDADGIFSDADPDDNDPCVPNSTTANCMIDTTVVAIPDFFTDFSWLSDIVDPANCDGTIISIYQSGAFSFIYVETSESSTLYFENGTFYCQFAPNFDCLAAYNLSNPYEEWTCSGATIIDADNDGIPAQTDPDDNNPCIPNNTAANCETETIPVVIARPTFFDDYPWLTDLVNPADCNDERISIYDLGSFAFLFIETANYQQLYFENGTFYCESTPTYDCLAAYNLTTPTEVWECSSQIMPEEEETPDCNKNTGTIIFVDCDNGEEFFMIETTEGLILDIYFDTGIDFNYFEGQSVKFDFQNANFDSPCSIATKAIIITCIEEIRDTPIEIPPALFEQYTFLYNLIDPSDCSGANVTVYTSGAFDYLLVETATEIALYFQDGTFFCGQTPTYNCVTAYGFDDSNITNSWTCGEATFASEATSRNTSATLYPINSSAKKWAIAAYPNPAQDHLWVAINSQNAQSVQLNLLDKTGRLILQQSTNVLKGDNRFALTLSGVNSGMYYLMVEGQVTGERTVRKIMVVR